jgi:FkbM family methyltransferase
MPDLLRRLDALRGRAVTRVLWRVPGLPRLYRASRGQIVDEPARFAANELLGRPGVHRYGLRGRPGTILLRHGPSDVAVIDEFFWWGFYDPPPAVESAVAALGRPPRIVDLGAHVGIFGVWAGGRWPGCRLTSVEADAENARVCERTIAVNGAEDRWTLVRAAASNRVGTVEFAGGQRAQSRVEAGAGHPRIPAVDTLELMADADVVKIDIEGAEWDILADDRFREIPALAVTLEYHPHLAPGADAQREALRLLATAGFTEHVVEELPGGLGMAWAWRQGPQGSGNGSR